MSAHQDIPQLNAAGLRNFALTLGVTVAVLFGLFFPWLLDVSRPWWPWAFLVVFGLWGLAAPLSLRPIYNVWMRFGLVLHRIMTPLILGLMFFLVITPAALVMKMIGRDAMSRRIDATADS